MKKTTFLNIFLHVKSFLNPDSGHRLGGVWSPDVESWKDPADARGREDVRRILLGRRLQVQGPRWSCGRLQLVVFMTSLG